MLSGLCVGMRARMGMRVRCVCCPCVVCVCVIRFAPLQNARLAVLRSSQHSSQPCSVLEASRRVWQGTSHATCQLHAVPYIHLTTYSLAHADTHSTATVVQYMLVIDSWWFLCIVACRLLAAAPLAPWKKLPVGSTRAKPKKNVAQRAAAAATAAAAAMADVTRAAAANARGADAGTQPSRKRRAGGSAAGSQSKRSAAAVSGGNGASMSGVAVPDSTTAVYTTVLDVDTDTDKDKEKQDKAKTRK